MCRGNSQKGGGAEKGRKGGDSKRRKRGDARDARRGSGEVEQGCQG